MLEAEVASAQLTPSTKREVEEEEATHPSLFQWTTGSRLTLSAPLQRDVPLVPETEEAFAEFQALAAELVGVPREELDAARRDAEDNLRALRDEGEELRQRHQNATSREAE